MKEVKADRIKFLLRHYGLKRLKNPDGLTLMPRADLYIDCRVVKEKGITGVNGDDPKFQTGIKKACPDVLDNILANILNSLQVFEDRRSSRLFPYAEPYVVCFMCAYGMHRSRATKHIMAERLKALGFNVEVDS